MPRPQLLTYSTNELVPLPAWAQFFLEVGAVVGGAEEDPARRITIALSLPTRAFAAALTGTGIVLRRASISINDNNPARHFKEICLLPAGTAITFSGGTGGSQRFTGQLLSVQEVNGEQRVGVLVHRGRRLGNMTYWFNQTTASTIRIADPSLHRLTTTANGNRPRLQEDFLASLLHPVTPYQFAQHSRIDCLFVASPTIIRGEVCDCNFYVNAAAPGIPVERHLEEEAKEQKLPCRGPLMEILRVRRLLPERQEYRSEIVSARTVRSLSRDGIGTAYTTLFDGSAAFLRLGACLPASHRIVILDRTERTCGDAAGALNQQYLQRLESAAPLRLPIPPKGIEVLAFEEAVR